MPRTKASRKYLITINNPIEHGFPHDVIKKAIADFPSVVYWCMSDEKGSVLHTHVYIAFKNAVEFSNIQKHFYGAHIDSARGSHEENRDYILKQGKWENTDKHETRIHGSFEESGELPEEQNTKVLQSEAVLAMIQSGCSDLEIVTAFPSQMNHIKNIGQVRQLFLEDKYKHEFRKLTVNYIWGQSGVGKTRSVMEQFGYENVYRVTDYNHPFDSYNSQDVILFDEFRSSLPFNEMLTYLEGYPLTLPCRYSNKQACYTKVYVISNIPFEKQYPNIQAEEINSWQAFKRRFDSIYEMLDSNDSLLF